MDREGTPWRENSIEVTKNPIGFSPPRSKTTSGMGAGVKQLIGPGPCATEELILGTRRYKWIEEETTTHTVITLSPL